MVSSSDPKNQLPPQPLFLKAAYIREAPLRLLARLIARDILANKPFLIHKLEVIKAPLKAENNNPDGKNNLKSENE